MKKTFSSVLIFSFLFVYVSSFAQWDLQTDGLIPLNHRIYSLKIAPDNSIWAISTFDASPPAASASIKIHRSTDEGITWTSHELPESGETYGWDISPVDSLIAYAALSPIGGLLKTTDGGATWTPLESYPTTPLCVHFFNENEGWVFDRVDNDWETMSVTTDGGITWTHIGGQNWEQPAGTSLPSEDTNEQLLTPFYATTSNYAVAGSTIILGTWEGRYYISHDKGYNWTRHDSPWMDMGLMVGNVTIKDSTTFMFSTDISHDFNFAIVQTLATTDGGNTWTHGSPNIRAAATRYIPGSNDIFIISGHSDFGLDDTEGTAITYDYGETWKKVDDNRLLVMDFNSYNNGYAACCNGQWASATGGIYKWNPDFISSIQVAEKMQNLRLSPNPASDFINILLSENQQKVLEVSLIDAQGKLIRQLSLVNNFSIPIKDLPNGMYYLKAVADGKVYLGKFTKF